MALQHTITVKPKDFEYVNEHLGVAHDNERTTFFNASGPIYTFEAGDHTAMRLAAAILTDPEVGLATPSQLAKAIGRHRSRIHDYRNLYQEGGIKELRPKSRGPKGPTKFKGTVVARAQKYLNQGKSNYAVGRLVGVSEHTIRKGIKDGRLYRMKPTAKKEKTGSNEVKSTRSQRSLEDVSCIGGMATKRDTERALAPTGLLDEVKPAFNPAESVGRAGVLVSLAALLGQGLVDTGKKVYGSLKNGYYGLTTMLLTFGLMALMRIKSIEGLSSHAPGEFGIVLGLDRAPEIKTARRKLAELAARGKAHEFSRALATRWADENPDALGYLYIDGHVRPYHGRKHKLPKTHVQKRRLCMPATTDYWVNDTYAEPLMFVTAAANEGLLEMMEKELLPEIRSLVGDERRVTLVFDREGWSPKAFKRWSDAGFDVMTYRKGKYTDWPAHSFNERIVDVCGKKVEYLLAEQMNDVVGGFRMREVRRLCPDGHQTSVMTTRYDISMEAVALRMFSRWQQENFFRYMRQEYALDHLPTVHVEPADPERSVPNPDVRKKKRELNRLEAKLAKAEQSYGQKAHDNSERKHRTVRGFKISHAKLGREIKRLRLACEQLRAEIKTLPKRMPVRQIMDGKPVVRLERERKRITDTIKMVAYRAETQLANLVRPLLPSRGDEARKFMRQVFELPADLLPDYDNGKLKVQLHSMSTHRYNLVLKELCGVLNDLGVFYPGTKLKLVFSTVKSDVE